MTVEGRASAEDRLLEAAGGTVCTCKAVNIHVANRAAGCEFQLLYGNAHADHLLYIKGKGAGIVRPQ